MQLSRVLDRMAAARMARLLAALAAIALSATAARADLAVPAYSSNPGAAYTVYLDFGGFSYNGTWGSHTPGVRDPYSTDGDTTTFNSTDLKDIQVIWSRVAEKYAAFNVNVTTVDPDTIAGQTDAQRQYYYDTHAKMMHTIIGGNNSAFGGGGGISFVGTTKNTYNPTLSPNTNGYHTDFIFSTQAPKNTQFVGEAASHENGHGLGLQHQADYDSSLSTPLVNEYSSGTSGAGSVAPIMGDSYSKQRGLFAVGTKVNGVIQNDVQVIDSNPGLNIIDDGVGHTLATASALAITGGTIDSNTDKGVITPNPADATPDPTGASHYTTDYWTFTLGSGGGSVDIKVNSGRSTITPGAADPGATLDAMLAILDSSGTVVDTSSFVAGQLNAELTDTLGAGQYYARIMSSANVSDTTYTPRYFYDMGSYFVSGTVVGVPEPASFALLLLGIAACLLRRTRPIDA